MFKRNILRSQQAPASEGYNNPYNEDYFHL